MLVSEADQVMSELADKASARRLYVLEAAKSEAPDAFRDDIIVSRFCDLPESL